MVVLGLSCGVVDDASPPDNDHVGETREIAAGPYLNSMTSDEPPRIGGRLVYGLPAETNSWNPSIANWAAYSMQVARALFDPVYLFDADGNVQNNLVEKVEHNADHTEWITTIRPGVKFHNGRTLTAADIVNATNYYRESPVLGGTFHLFAITEEVAISERSYRTRTSKPWPTFRQQATHQLAFIIEPQWLRSSDFAKPIGTGPFKIETWEPGKRLTVTRNPDYWRRDRWGNTLPYLDRIEFQVITDDQERANALKTGKLDIMMQTLTTPDILTLQADCRNGQLQCFSDVKGETPEDLVVLNTTKPPLNGLAARRALALAIDRADFVKQLTGGLNEPADSMYSPASPWYSPTAYPNYDPAEATRLAEQVKARNRGTFRFELLTAPTEDALRVAQYLQAAWKKVGIDVDVSTTDNQKKIIRQVSGDFQASLTQMFDDAHPASMTVWLDPAQAREGGFSMVVSRLNDPEIGHRIETLMRGEPSEIAWRAATAELVERVNTLIPFIWLDHAPRTIIARPNVVNVVRATLPEGQPAQDFHLGSHALSQIWIKPN
jgi:peptide/nickel transport system substrate-binding protein